MPGSSATARLTKLASICSLILFGFSAGVTYAGTDDMGIQTDAAWQICLALAAIGAVCPWIIYILRGAKEDLTTACVNSLFILTSVYWVFGFMGYFFYFLFAPISDALRAAGVGAGLLVSLSWGRLVWRDLMAALASNGWQQKLYAETVDGYLYTEQMANAFAEVPRRRDPVRAIHFVIALAIAPAVLVLNRLLAPLTGSGHGVFLVLAFLGLPMSLWIVGFAVRTYVLMLHVPHVLRRQTGKSVLMQGFE